MASDVIAVPAYGYSPGLETPDWGLSPLAGAVVMPGVGMEYIGEPVEADDRLCTRTTKAGSPCKAFAGDDGLCVGHRKAV